MFFKNLSTNLEYSKHQNRGFHVCKTLFMAIDVYVIQFFSETITDSCLFLI